MFKKLVAIGNSLGVVIPKSVCDRFEMVKGSSIELQVDACKITLILSPERSVEGTAQKVMEDHDEIFKKLAQ